MRESALTVAMILGIAVPGWAAVVVEFSGNGGQSWQDLTTDEDVTIDGENETAVGPRKERG